MLLLESAKRKLFAYALLVSVLGLSSACDGEEKGSELTLGELVSECLIHSGDADDPCPRRCTQITPAWLAKLDEDGGCSIEPVRFCVPGEENEYWTEIDAYTALQRMEVDETSTSSRPFEPEDVRIVDVDHEPPGWRYCQPDNPSTLCQCGSQQAGQM